jgi:hypothetical protein
MLIMTRLHTLTERYVFTDNTVSVPSTSEMKFLRANDTLGYSGTINASALWKTRLTNAELISLTTL